MADGAAPRRSAASAPPGAPDTADARPADTDGTRAPDPGVFHVHLENFTGPFDLLLSLISRRKMDITEVALAEVTDEFVAYIRAREDWDLSQASEFLVVAATLLDMKSSRLLPGGTETDAEDLELLEARDLLFARLLQYRAFKQVAARFEARLADQARRVPRAVELPPEFRALLPELIWTIGPTDLARIAASALAPRPEPPGIALGHLHAPAVSVRQELARLADHLRAVRAATFAELVADARDTLVVVARFLALLELFRAGAVTFEQAVALGELTVRWTGRSDARDIAVDDYAGAPSHPQEPT